MQSSLEKDNGALFEGQKSTDRHDIIARVFYMKAKQLINVLTKGKVFGPTLAFTYSIEWQKRGLPHVHIILWLINKIRANDVDNIISAEIPDVKTDPDLHEIVINNMIHGPCGTTQNARA